MPRTSCQPAPPTPNGEKPVSDDAQLFTQIAALAERVSAAEMRIDRLTATVTSKARVTVDPNEGRVRFDADGRITGFLLDVVEADGATRRSIGEVNAMIGQMKPIVIDMPSG